MYKSALRKIVISLGLAAFLSFFMRSFLAPGLPKTHDSNPHISRAINYHTALLDGQRPPMWAKEVLGGIGSSVLMLNYQLPYFVGEIWQKLGADVFESYKLTLAATYVFSGVLMYLGLQSRYSTKAAWIGALLYTLAPYRMVDIYVRGALGEAMSFMFPPLLLWGHLKESRVLLILGWSGLFMTHPVATALFSGFFFFYTFVAKIKFDWTAYFVALLISSFNILPTLAYTQYTYYSPSLSDTLTMFPSLLQLMHSKWGYGVSLPGINDGMSFEIGYVQILTLLIGSLIVFKLKRAVFSYYVGGAFLTIFFMLESSKIFYELILGRIIDFPWRLLLCLVFVISLIGAELTTQLKDSTAKYLAIFLTLTLYLQTIPMAKVNEYWGVEHTESFFAKETGDSYGEYAPVWRATRDSSPFGLRAELVSGEGHVQELVMKSNHQQYKVFVTSKNAQFRINTAFFKGWEYSENCYITRRTNPIIDDSGLFMCELGEGEHILEIKFNAPYAQKIGNILSVAGIIIFIWIVLASFSPHITKKRQ